jgi:hypothetical protein
MKLNVISQVKSLDEAKQFSEQYFHQALRYFQVENSIFTAWIIRPVDRIHIPGIWRYRIMFQNEYFYFGTIA